MLDDCNKDCDDAENLIGHGNRTAGRRHRRLRHDGVDYYSSVMDGNGIDDCSIFVCISFYEALASFVRVDLSGTVGNENVMVWGTLAS